MNREIPKPEFDPAGKNSNINMEEGQRFYVGKRENHHIRQSDLTYEKELQEVYVQYYEIEDTSIRFEDSEMWVHITFGVHEPIGQKVTNIQLDHKEVGKAINDGKLIPTDMSINEMWSASSREEL